MTSPTQHFQMLGAKLRNPRWSWGAERSDGSIILRAWDDEIRTIDGKKHIRLTNNPVYAGGSHPGYRERLRQIQRIREGASGYIVVCTAKVPLESNRRIKAFDERSLIEVNAVRDFGGNQWAELGKPIAVRDLLE